ncbi:barstar family protein [Streptomyces sirii]|uniref:barstar family protein n=1 Tax=Streptomyces sirii TaxID=3127701 RepID=UPI003D363B22
MTAIYVLEGTQIRTLDDFWRVIGEAVNGPGGYFGRNLDAFADCLSGGFGAPDDDDYVVEWRDHKASRECLGYAETARQLEIRLWRCHPTNRPAVSADLVAAREERGMTVFDWLTEIFEDRAPGVLRLQ